jgi:hypothetical protein
MTQRTIPEERDKYGYGERGGKKNMAEILPRALQPEKNTIKYLWEQKHEYILIYILLFL